MLAPKPLTIRDADGGHEVLLVGGQSRMPLVHERVAAFFGKQPSRAVHPDEAVAVGAALLAHSLGSAEGVVLIDVLPMSIGIGLPGDRVKTIIERNTPLPARKQYGLTTSRDGQTDFELVIVQGESPIAAECEYLGTLRLDGLPAGPRGMAKIAVTFELGAECLLTVTARELNTGKQVQAVMSTKEGPSAARRRLEHGGGDADKVETAPFLAPPPLARGGLGGFLRRLFGEVLSQNGFGFHRNNDGARTAASLVDMSAERALGINPDATEPLQLSNSGHPASNTISLAHAKKSHVDALGLSWNDASGRNNSYARTTLGRKGFASERTNEMVRMTAPRARMIRSGHQSRAWT